MEETKEVLTLKSKVNLKCEICDRCCKYRGDIRLTPINVIEISKFLKISIEEFLEKYTYELKGDEPEIAIKAVGEDRVCILNDIKTNKCKIQKVKPIQCVMFPLMPINVEQDLFINLGQCKVDPKKKTTVDKWLNGNNKIYKRNKNIYLKWIELLEEMQPKWNSISKEKQEKIKTLLFKNYTTKEKYEKQIIENIKKVRELIYN